jgi:hypothetical protein
MDLQPQTTKPISDDQELAKVLAGVSQESNNLGFEETPATPAVAVSAEPTTEDITAPVIPQVPVDTIQNPVNNELDSIKKDALLELRPLVDKLDLAPEDKFDTYLLLIRSTDDRALIGPAHLAAQNIPDETKRAQALLEIIKEIDFLSTP